MRFEQAIRAGFRNYAEFGGRASRPEFWWWILFTALVTAALNALFAWPLTVVPGFHGPVQPGGVAGAWSIAVLLPTLGVTVRRLRDAGYGWGHLFWVLAPIVGLVVLAVLCAQPPRLRPSQEVPATGEAAVPAERP